MIVEQKYSAQGEKSTPRIVLGTRQWYNQRYIYLFLLGAMASGQFETESSYIRYN
jgi:hypothetical protein